MPHFVEIRVAGQSFRARVLEERSPAAAAALRELLPIRARLYLDEWSGFLARITTTLPIQVMEPDQKLGFAYPGLVMADAHTGGLAVCYGQARLRDGVGAIPLVPLLEIGGDVQPLARIGERLQYDGSQVIELVVPDDQSSPLMDPPRESARSLVVELGGVSAVADVLERSSPVTTAALVAQLPLAGAATNTFLSGPLVRFRDPAHPAGEVILETRDEEISHLILYPGFVYYRALPPYGLRIALRDATTMAGILGGETKLVPLARFLGDWSAIRTQAVRLVEEGQMPIRLSLLA